MTRVIPHILPCLLCGELTAPEPHPILGAPVCRYCLIQSDYEDCNTRTSGTPDGDPLFSVEFEVCSEASSRSRSHALVLLKHGYLRTADESVEDEYKSPRYLGLAAFQEVLPVLDSLKDLVDSCCGTHIHIDCPVQAQVQNHAQALFAPLVTYLSTHPSQTARFWGRSSVEVVRTHTRYDTIEFRLPRFRTAEQYLNVVRFCRAVGHTLNLHLDTRLQACNPLPSARIGEDILALYQGMAELPAATESEDTHV